MRLFELFVVLQGTNGWTPPVAVGAPPLLPPGVKESSK